MEFLPLILNWIEHFSYANQRIDIGQSMYAVTEKSYVHCISYRVASGHVVYGVMDDMLCIACRQLLTGTFWSSDGRVLTTAPNMWSSNISPLRWKHGKCNIVITDIRSQFVLLKPKATLLYWPSVKLHISYIALGKHYYCLQQIQERCIPVTQGAISGDNKRDRPP